MAIKPDSWSVFCNECGHAIGDSHWDREFLEEIWDGEEQVCDDCRPYDSRVPAAGQLALDGTEERGPRG